MCCDDCKKKEWCDHPCPKFLEEYLEEVEDDRREEDSRPTGQTQLRFDI